MQTSTPTTPLPGLSGLGQVKLDPRYQELYEAAKSTCAGPAPWAARKLREVCDLMALAQVSQRIDLQWLDLRDDFRVVFHLRVPVATRPDPHGDIVIRNYATIGLTYRAEAARLPQPGYSFVHLLAPASAWYANIPRGLGPLPDFGNPICLGTTLPAGSRVRELVVLTYLSLSMQTTQINPADSAGLFRPEVARFWQHNLNRIPLSRTPFIVPGMRSETTNKTKPTTSYEDSPPR